MSDGGFKLNFTEQEAASEARERSDLPSGSYLVDITDAELNEVQAGPNKGKPMVNFEFTVVEDSFAGQFTGRKAWSLVMLFEGALYSAAQLMKAVDLVPGHDDFPDIEEWLGKRIVMVGQQEDAKAKDPSGATDAKGKPKYVTKYEDVPDPTDPAKTIKKAVKQFAVKGYKHPNTWNKVAAAQKARTEQVGGLKIS